MTANLRYSFESERYSEDIDLDALEIEPRKLAGKVDEVLSGKTLEHLLRTGGITLDAPARTSRQTPRNGGSRRSAYPGSGRAPRGGSLGADERSCAFDGAWPMKATEALGSLLRVGRPIIATREAAVRLGMPTGRASQLLGALEKAGLVRRIRRGLWTLQPDVDPLRLPPCLAAPLPAYVSFWSALAHHGMIQQIPRRIFVASLDRTRQLATTLGTYSIHHMKPEVFGGYDGSEATGYIATPEKALFDTVYLRAPGGGTVALPELDLPDPFSSKALEPWVDRISHPRLRTLVSRGLDRILESAAPNSG